MVEGVDLSLILGAALIASASPGPATLALAGTSMAAGRAAGLALAAGIMTGSLIWSCVAALGFGAVMLANAWMLEILRYAGALYLLFLAVKSARAALGDGALATRAIRAPSRPALYGRGVLLHLTNPKAILFFGALYAVGVPAGASPATLVTVILAVGLQSCVIFHGYALLFSSARVAGLYLRLRRWFEAVFALAFAAAGLKILTTRLH
ncbi:LysE family translocator [Marivibrio halodurans]|uniref:LysE family translocator n=1 Tax=Marivibrio halodurans TaxID=2039722 RepID=A0A8J7S741_9PROT|nr:LysE family translocator [Marivibrio halodurans]MBP5856792.1 LysE family translocator [Marivibrio halodurans]